MNRSDIIIKNLLTESVRLTSDQRDHYKRLVKRLLISSSDDDLLKAARRHMDTYSTALKEKSHDAVGSYFRGVNSIEKLKSEVIGRILPLFDQDIVSFRTGPDNIVFDSSVRGGASVTFFSQYNQLTPEQSNDVLNANDDLFLATDKTFGLTTRVDSHYTGSLNTIVLDLLFAKFYLIPNLKEYNSSLCNFICRFLRSLITKSSNMEDDGPESMDDVPARIVVSTKGTDVKLLSIYPWFSNEGTKNLKTKNWNIYAGALLKTISTILPKGS